MNRLARTVRTIILLILILPIALLVLYFFICPLVNDAAAAKYEKMLLNIPLPRDAKILESASYCGNTSGASNGVEIWAGLLIHTNIAEEEVIAFFEQYKFNAYQMIWHVPEDLTEAYPAPHDYIDQAFSYHDDHGHEIFQEKKAALGYYIVGGYYAAPTQWDIRGH